MKFSSCQQGAVCQAIFSMVEMNDLLRARNVATTDAPYLRLLQLGDFVRRSRGGWRFGTKIVADQVVERLIAAGQAEIHGDRLRLKRDVQR